MRVYSFKNTIVVVNGVEISGWSEGDDVIKIGRLNDSATHKIGADGTMMMSISADRSGEFTFKLMQTSPSNKFLSSLIQLQEGGALTFVPITVLFQDLFRQDRAAGTAGYLKKPAEIQRGKEGQEQEWTIVVERLDMLLGDPALVAAVATAVLT